MTAQSVDQSERTWSSAHLFIHGEIMAPAGDRVITNVVAPFLRHAHAVGWIERFFFIRYGEFGPHVRIRMYGNATVLANTVQPALEQHVADVLPAELCGTPHAQAKTSSRTSRLPSLHWFPYEPEFERYGGASNIVIAEEFFYRSSEVSFDLVAGYQHTDRSARLGVGLGAIIALIGAFASDENDATRLAALHRNQMASAGPPAPNGASWSTFFDQRFERDREATAHHVQRCWQAATGRLSWPLPLSTYATAASDLRTTLRSRFDARMLGRGSIAFDSWIQATDALVPSYVHMTSNRLGVSPIEEAYLSHVFVRVLAEL